MDDIFFLPVLDMVFTFCLERADCYRVMFSINDHHPFIQNPTFMTGQLAGEFCGPIHVESVHDTEHHDRQGRIIMDNILGTETLRVFLGNKIG